MEWIKLKSLIIVIPMLIVLPFWLTMVAYANLPFQPAGGAPQTFTGASARSNMMVQGKNGQGQMVAPPFRSG